MASGVKIHLNIDLDVNKQINKINNSIEEYNKTLDKKLRQISMEYRRNIKKASPVDTGNLKNSINIAKHNLTSDEVKYSIYTNVDYAIYVEEGTSKSDANNFFKRGLSRKNNFTANPEEMLVEFIDLLKD